MRGWGGIDDNYGEGEGSVKVENPSHILKKKQLNLSGLNRYIQMQASRDYIFGIFADAGVGSGRQMAIMGKGEIFRLRTIG